MINCSGFPNFLSFRIRRRIEEKGDQETKGIYSLDIGFE